MVPVRPACADMDGNALPVWKFSAEGVELEDAFSRVARELSTTKATTLGRCACALSHRAGGQAMTRAC